MSDASAGSAESSNPVTDLLQKVGADIANRREAAPHTAPDFNIFRMLDPHENALSAVLAKLLDPSGSHEQRTTFLKSFFDCILHVREVDLTGSVNVKTEFEIAGKRRIDIVVETNKFVLAIENKPWAGDQPAQVSDYLAYLRQRESNGVTTLLLYLSRDESEPNSCSISRDELEASLRAGKLRLSSYAKLVPWLKKCEKEARAQKVKHFLTDFIAYIEFQFGRAEDLIEYDRIIASYFWNAKYVEAALCIRNGNCAEQDANVAESISQALNVFAIQNLEKLRDQISALVDPRWAAEVKSDFDIRFKFGQRLSVGFSGSPNYVFSFAFADSGFPEELHWGIECADREHPPESLNGVAKTFTEQLNGCQNKLAFGEWKPGSETWLCYMKVDEMNWHSYEPWQQITSGDDLANKIVRKITDLHTLLIDEDLLRLLSSKPSATSVQEIHYSSDPISE